MTGCVDCGRPVGPSVFPLGDAGYLCLACLARRRTEPPACDGCGLVMSWREADEQGFCNDCLRLTWAPSETDR